MNKFCQKPEGGDLSLTNSPDETIGSPHLDLNLEKTICKGSGKICQTPDPWKLLDIKLFH